MTLLRGGKKTCDVCSKECTSLPGFEMRVLPNMMGDERVNKAVTEIKDEFGQHDFTFCWSCTAKAFGMKGKNEEEPEDKTEHKAYFEAKAPKAKQKKK